MTYTTLDDSVSEPPAAPAAEQQQTDDAGDNTDESNRNPLTTVAFHAAARGSLVAPLSPVKTETDEEMGLIKKEGSAQSGIWPPSAWYILGMVYSFKERKHLHPVVEFCERLSFYGATIVFYPYMKHMLGWNQSTQNAVYNAFNFWAYGSTLIGGFVADTYTGKVKALYIFSTSSLIGLVLLFLSALPLTWNNFPHDPSDGFAVPGFTSAIFFLGLGTGGIKVCRLHIINHMQSNVSTLMADQIRDASPSVYSAVFRWFYWAINLGAFIGILATPVLHNEIGEKKDIGDGDTDGTGYWASFGLPMVAFMLGILIFATGHVKGLYIENPPKGSLFTECYRSAIHARKAKKGAIACGKYVPKEHWLDWADNSEYESVAKDFKACLKACRVFYFYPLYWLCYNQLFSNLVEQADLLKRPDWVPAESLNVVGSASLIIMIPIFDKFVFPTLKRFNYDPSLLTRIPIGFFLGSLSITYVAVLEHFIQNNEAVCCTTLLHATQYKQSGANGGDKLSDIPIWYQLPPYVIFGMSEIFSSVGGLEFAYTIAPKSMKSVVMSMFLLTNAVSSVIGMIISPAVKPENMVEVYFSFGGTLFAVFVLFVLIYHPSIRRRICCWYAND